MSALTPAPAPVPDTNIQSQCLGEFLSRVRKLDPHPAVLDLGIVCGDNIAFLGSKGCRVSVDSLTHNGDAAAETASAATASGRAAAPLARPLLPLSYPVESFSGILAWDGIPRTPPAQAAGLVERLRLLLVAGGVILAYFPGPPGLVRWRPGRFRMKSEDRVIVEPADQRRLPPHAYQNREIYALFSRFDVVRLSHHKSGTREVLVARSRRPGGA